MSWITQVGPKSHVLCKVSHRPDHDHRSFAHDSEKQILKMESHREGREWVFRGVNIRLMVQFQQRLSWTYTQKRYETSLLGSV